jgi:hypothetical protein
MHDNSSDGDDGRPTDPSEPEAQKGIAGEELNAVDYLRLAEECLLVASLTKDPEKSAELVKTGDEYLRRAANWLADRIKDR